jgi:transposase
MSRRQKDPLRPLSEAERTSLSRLSRSQSAPAAQVARARALLAVAEGQSYTAAAQLVGREVGDTVARWVAGFNRDGLAALVPHHGGGHRVRYGEAEQLRILAEVVRTPERARDGTATWSLTTLRDALRRAEDGLPGISTHTIGRALHAAGYTAGRRGGVGARPAWSCASASTQVLSPSPIRMPRQKGADRTGLHA